MQGHDFLIESRLHELDPDLHKRFSESTFVLQKLLSDYLILFPEYTDHTETHSIAIIDYCNNLIGDDIDNLNADEIYILLMACYLHDVGMGVSEKDYHEFCEQIDFSERMPDYKEADMADVVRAFHNDFSACFIRKYSHIFDFPTEAHEFAVIQTARGHRKADLFDEEEYPAELPLDNGNKVCLPYLASLLRLADEVNVAKDRNLKLMVDTSWAHTRKQRLEYAKHEAIKKMTIFSDRIELLVETNDAEVSALVSNLAIKLQKTLDYCVNVVDARTKHRITQKRVIITS